MQNTINCPNCNTEIEITEALRKTISPQFEKDIELKARQAFDKEQEVLVEELKFKTKKLDEAREESLNLHKEKLKLEDEKKSFELDKQKQLNEEREKIRQQTLLEFSDQHRLKDAEKEKMINDLKKSLEDAQIRASQSSQQLQGEVQELDLEEFLTQTFPYDEIIPVEKGVRGADVKQLVRTNKGTNCGAILWESKRTKAWAGDWIQKLKDDLRSSKANIPVIVSSVMPKGLNTGFGSVDGVWICEPKFIKPLAEVLRQGLINVAREKYTGQDRGTKADAVYDYLTSNEFRQQVESIIEAHSGLMSQIQKEKVAFEKIWKEREAQAQRIIGSTARIYGSIAGLAGASLPSIPALSLPE